MISVIICSRASAALAAISKNVADTIGVAHEVIAVDNSGGRYGICEAYNVGATSAKYDLLCFMHEDIRFHTPEWGQVVAQIVADPSIGVLGVTGGQYQVASPAAWWGCGLDLCRENVLNVFPDGHTEMDLRNPENQPLADVAVVDGLWMCSRKEVWQQHPFDARTFPDFHFYDIDYCTEIYLSGLRVCVTFQVLIEHHSRGSVNASWLWNALRYQKKRQGKLPFGPVVPSLPKRRELELKALQEFINRLIQANFPKRIIARYLLKAFPLSPLSRDTLWLVKHWIQTRRSAQVQR